MSDCAAHDIACELLLSEGSQDVSTTNDSDDHEKLTETAETLIDINLSSNEHIRYIPEEEWDKEIIDFAIYAGKPFFNIDLVDGNRALQVRDAILREHSRISLDGVANKDAVLAGSGCIKKSIQRGNKQSVIEYDGAKIDMHISSTKMNNFRLINIGRYGDDKQNDILSILQFVIGKSDKAAATKILFKKIADYGKQGKALSVNDLYETNQGLKQTNDEQVLELLKQLQAVVQLITYIEIVRRPGYNIHCRINGNIYKSKFACREIMLSAWLQVSKLLQDGILTIEQVFSCDAPYGMPTGSELNKKEDKHFINKYTAIHDLYMSIYYAKETAAAKAQHMKVALTLRGYFQLYNDGTTNVACVPSEILSTFNTQENRAKMNVATITPMKAIASKRTSYIGTSLAFSLENTDEMVCNANKKTRIAAECMLERESSPGSEEPQGTPTSIPLIHPMISLYKLQKSIVMQELLTTSNDGNHFKIESLATKAQSIQRIGMQ